MRVPETVSGSFNAHVIVKCPGVVGTPSSVLQRPSAASETWSLPPRMAFDSGGGGFVRWVLFDIERIVHIQVT
jgi:hypothetical protein